MQNKLFTVSDGCANTDNMRITLDAVADVLNTNNVTVANIIIALTSKNVVQVFSAAQLIQHCKTTRTPSKHICVNCCAVNTCTIKNSA